MWGHETLGNVCWQGLFRTEGEPSGAGPREVIVIIVISLRRQGLESHAQVEGLSSLGSSRDTSPIATGQKAENTNIDAERLKGRQMAKMMFRSDCFCFLNQAWGKAKRGGVGRRRGGVGGLRGSGNTHFGEWESTDLYGRLPSGRSEGLCEIGGYRWIVITPASLVFSTGVQLLLHRTERDCTKWRLLKWIKCSSLENSNLILHWSKDYAQNWPFSLLKSHCPLDLIFHLLIEAVELECFHE